MCPKATVLWFPLPIQQCQNGYHCIWGWGELWRTPLECSLPSSKGPQHRGLLRSVQANSLEQICMELHCEIRSVKGAAEPAYFLDPIHLSPTPYLPLPPLPSHFTLSCPAPTSPTHPTSLDVLPASAWPPGSIVAHGKALDFTLFCVLQDHVLRLP